MPFTQHKSLNGAYTSRRSHHAQELWCHGKMSPTYATNLTGIKWQAILEHLLGINPECFNSESAYSWVNTHWHQHHALQRERRCHSLGILTLSFSPKRIVQADFIPPQEEGRKRVQTHTQTSLGSKNSLGSKCNSNSRPKPCRQQENTHFCLKCLCKPMRACTMWKYVPLCGMELSYR